MKEFELAAKCPKCGCIDVIMKWKERDDSMECLRLRCRRCEYLWAMECADKNVGGLGSEQHHCCYCDQCYQGKHSLMKCEKHKHGPDLKKRLG